MLITLTKKEGKRINQKVNYLYKLEMETVQ